MGCDRACGSEELRVREGGGCACRARLPIRPRHPPTPDRTHAEQVRVLEGPGLLAHEGRVES